MANKGPETTDRKQDVKLKLYITIFTQLYFTVVANDPKGETGHLTPNRACHVWSNMHIITERHNKRDPKNSKLFYKRIF